jgi:hypothetical protein
MVLNRQARIRPAAPARVLAAPRERNWQIAATLLLAGAALALLAQSAGAAGDVKLDQGGSVLDVDSGRGMSPSNKRVAPILASYPNQYAVICVAGCIGRPHVVQLLPQPVAARSGGYVPTSARIEGKAYGPPAPRQTAQRANNDVVCVAGCTGPTGQVLQRINDLPPEGQAGGGAHEARSIKPKKYEPLDVFP